MIEPKMREADGPHATAPERASGVIGTGVARAIPAEEASVMAAAAEILPSGVCEPIKQLLGALDRAGIRYCHWKSNIRLGLSLVGTGDLDLLVDRDDASRFESALIDSGFKLTVSGTGIGHPGVFHAFALDPERASLIHVHAYFQVVTGDSLVKSYHLPIEDALLSGDRRLHDVPVPSAETELVLFALRIALKHTSLVEVWLIHRNYGEIPHELAWLRATADPVGVEAVWRAWLPNAPVSLLSDLMAAIDEPSAVLQRIRLGLQVARHLRHSRRLGRIAVAASRCWRIATLTLGRLRRRRGLVLPTGGVIIAFVGPKATGKSTLSSAVAKRLGHHFDVRRVHVGKPPATVLSLVPRLLLPLARRLAPNQSSRDYEAPERLGERRYSLLHVLRMAVLAHDRRALLRRCWRHAATGAIVIADRYPSASIGMADSSRFNVTALAQSNFRLKRWLMASERACYAGLPQPRLVIRLTAPLETTIWRDAKRNKEDPPNATAVAQRRQIETETEFPGARVVCVDTNQPLEATLRTVMHAVWATI